MSKRQFWAHVSDLEPVAEHVAPPVVSEQPSATQTRPEETAPVVSPQVGDTVRLVKRPEMYGENRWWPTSCIEVVK